MPCPGARRSGCAIENLVVGIGRLGPPRRQHRQRLPQAGHSVNARYAHTLAALWRQLVAPSAVESSDALYSSSHRRELLRLALFGRSLVEADRALVARPSRGLDRSRRIEIERRLGDRGQLRGFGEAGGLCRVVFGLLGRSAGHRIGGAPR